MLLLLNQAWVHLPATQQSQSLLTPGCGEGKAAFITGAKKGELGSLCSEDCIIPSYFQGKTLKSNIKEVRVCACMINL